MLYFHEKHTGSSVTCILCLSAQAPGYSSTLDPCIVYTHKQSTTRNLVLEQSDLSGGTRPDNKSASLNVNWNRKQ